METSLGSLARALGAALEERGWKLATAESCTGGWIAKAVTDIAGSSAWFDRGFVTYSNEAKHELLGVDERTLAKHGAVSAQTALEMVAGALAGSGADIAVAVTGVAGPTGGTPQRPVGTVWIAWAARGETAHAAVHRLAGDREAVRLSSVVLALRGLLERLGYHED